ncbi:hypothetical protein ES707_17984 [subsurface metagenome]
MDVSPTIQNPHGRIRSITGTDPDAGAEVSITVPDRRRWKLYSVRFTLVTDVNAANRIVELTIDDGTNYLLTLPSDTIQLASLTRRYNYSIQPVPQFLVGYDFHLPLPSLTLSAGYRILTSTAELQATDDYAAPQLLVEEWIDP